MNCIKKIVSGVTALSLTCGLALTASAELHKGESKAYRGTGYLAKFEVVSENDGHCTVDVTIMNTSKKKINNWAVKFENYGSIESVKYGRVFSSDGYETVIRDCGINGGVAPNKCVTFRYVVHDKYDECEFPERIKVYSDADKSNTVDGLNTTAKNCYNAVAEVLADNYTVGVKEDECFKNGVFAKSNSSDGMKTGFNYKYSAEGDNAVNIQASQYAKGNINVYVGWTVYNDEKMFFVQVRDNKTGKIGQYPRPTNGTATWGTFTEGQIKNPSFSKAELDSAAKTAYNSMMEYLSDMEIENCWNWQECFENGGFPKSGSAEGLKIDWSASHVECDKYINDLLKYNYEGIIVNVGIDTSGTPYAFAKNPDGSCEGSYCPYPMPD